MSATCPPNPSTGSDRSCCANAPPAPLERLLTTALSRWNLIASYALVFGLLGALQAVLLALLILGPMGVSVPGPTWALLLVSLLDALFGVAFGLLAGATMLALVVASATMPRRTA